MGIDAFQPWLKQRFEKFFANRLVDISRKRLRNSPPKKIPIRRVFIDLNALVHNTVNVFYANVDRETRAHMIESPTVYWNGEEYSHNLALGLEPTGIPGLFDKIVDSIEDVMKVVNDANFEITNKYTAIDLLYLAADGVVPKAKLMQQRKRSYADVILNNLYGNSDANEHQEQRAQIFDRTQIKPGTNFMLELSKNVWVKLKERITKSLKPLKRYELSQAQESYALQFWPRNVEFSDASQPGEGEHKIMVRLKDHPKTPSNVYKNSADLFYSPDSDMAILTMIHTAEDDVAIVMRESDAYTRGYAANINNDNFSMEEREQLENIKWDFYNSTEIRSDLNYNEINNMYDFALLTIFAGNDFLPGMAFTNGSTKHRKEVFSSLIDSFKNARIGTFFDGKNILWGKVLQFLKQYQFVEEEFLDILRTDQIKNKSKYQIIDPEPGSVKDENNDNDDDQYVEPVDSSDNTKDRIWYTLINSAPAMKKQKRKVNIGIFSELYKREILGVFIPQYLIEQGKLQDDITNDGGGITTTTTSNIIEEFNFDELSEMIKAYLGGIKWIMNYYIDQFANVNTSWCYTFHYAPTMFDVSRFLYLHSDEFNQVNDETEHILTWEYEAIAKNEENTLPTPIEHLIAILPVSKLHLVPNIAADLFRTKLPEIYPSNIDVDWTLIPFTDIRNEEGKTTGEFKVDLGRELHKAVLLHDFPSLARIRDVFQSIQDSTEIQVRNQKTKVYKTKHN